jgi:Fe-S-cluster containining protein
LKQLSNTKIDCTDCIAPCCREYLSLLTFGERKSGDFEIMEVRPEFGLHALKQVNGKCVYLDEHNKCKIWDRRPAQCRVYDCRTDPRKPVNSKYYGNFNQDG